MIKTIRRIGDSYGVLLPRKELQQLGVAPNAPVSIVMKDGYWQVVPLVRQPNERRVEEATKALEERYKTVLQILARR
jgi:antitoxin component of MazEF toxin-antitoxin module